MKGCMTPFINITPGINHVVDRNSGGNLYYVFCEYLRINTTYHIVRLQAHACMWLMYAPNMPF